MNVQQKDIMKRLILFLLFAFLLSSCAPAATATPKFTLTQTAIPSLTATQTPSPIPILTPSLTPTPTPVGGGSGKLIFEYFKPGYENEFPNLQGDIHIFTSNVDGSNLIPITDGLNKRNFIESISPDGKMVLVFSQSSYVAKGDLYLINLSSSQHVSTKLATGLDGGQALFLDNIRIAYLGKGSQGYGFYIVNVDGTNPKKIGAPTGRVGRIASSNEARIYYEVFTKEHFKDRFGILYAYGDYVSLWWINIDGSGQGKLESNGKEIIPEFSLGNKEYAFSPDGTKIAWIPADLEQDCSYLSLAFWTPDIRNGTYTKYAGKTSLFLNRNSPDFGKVIDMAYVENYVRHCFIVHIAPLSDMDNDARIPLIPPFDPNKDDFYYHRDYVLKWWPDRSKILAYDTGFAMKRWGNMTGHYPLALYEVPLKDANPRLVQLKVLSNSLGDSFSSFNFSPDSRQILLTKNNQGNEGSMINVLNLETMNYVNDFGHNITPDLQVQRVGNIYWLP